MATDQTGHQPASLPIFPDVPLVGPIEWIEWAQNVGEYLSAVAKTFNLPGLVTNVTATQNATVIALQWNATRFATQYRIYRNTTGTFDSAAIIATIPASKTGVASLTFQDGQDQTGATRYYWITGVNERQQEGPKSAMVTVTNFSGATGTTAVGVDARASGTNSTAVGADATATNTDTTAVGQSSDASGIRSTAVGKDATASAQDTLAVGENATASSTQGIALGLNSIASNTATTAVGTSAVASAVRATAVGTDAEASADNSVSVGYNSLVNGAADGSVAVGYQATVAGLAKSIALGYNAVADKANQMVKGSLSGFLLEETTVMGANEQAFSLKRLTELTTIAAAATTDTVIQIPANVIVKAVTVRTTTAIPTAATYTVTGTSSGTVFNTAAVSTAANSTDKGNAAGAYYNATAQTIRITPDLTPAANTGRVRVTIIYEDITPATS